MFTIDELGVAGASASEIARRAGLSWGVVQYHFGDRLGLLLAAFEHSVALFEADLDSFEADGPLPRRVAALVDATWRLMEQPSYRSGLETQVDLSRQPAATRAYRKIVRRASKAASGAWLRTFPDIDTASVREVQDFVMTALRGYAVSHALGAGRARSRPSFRLLVESAVRALDDAA